MWFKKIIVGFVFALIIVGASAQPFSYDNYSKAPLLKYAFSYNGKDWFRPADDFVLRSRGYKTIDFNEALPMFWQIEASQGHSLQCWEAFVTPKKEVRNIVTLTKPEYAKLDNLLLDVIDDGDNIFISIIDNDGENTYSNKIMCRVE